MTIFSQSILFLLVRHCSLYWHVNNNTPTMHHQQQQATTNHEIKQFFCILKLCTMEEVDLVDDEVPPTSTLVPEVSPCDFCSWNFCTNGDNTYYCHSCKKDNIKQPSTGYSNLLSHLANKSCFAVTVTKKRMIDHIGMECNRLGEHTTLMHKPQTQHFSPRFHPKQSLYMVGSI